MPSIRKEITSGVFWIALAKYSGLLVSLVITAVLSRNISASAFGTMAVATVILTFLDIFTDIGIGVAIIQFKNLTRRQINSLFMIGVAIGVVLSVGLFFSSEAIASYYDDPVLIPICRLLCICLMFKALNIVPNGMMLRNKQFKLVSIRTFILHLTSGCVAIWGALHGWGVYALVVSPIISSVGVFIFNFCNYPQRLIVDIDWKAIKEVWSYSAFQFLFSFTNYFSRNLDKLIIGKYFSMADLGYYDKSYRLMQLPLQNITFVISPVLHPILSSLHDDKGELSNKNIKLTRLLSQLSFPIGITMYFCAPEIIRIIFGPNWQPAIPVFEILSLSIPLQMILSTCGSLFLAAGKSNHLFYTGILNTLFTVVGFLIAAICFKTIESMAWAWNITLLMGFIDSYYVMNRYTFGTSFRKFVKSLIPQLVNSVVVFSLAFVLFKSFSVNYAVLSLLVKSAIILILNCVLARFLKQYNILTVLPKYMKKGHHING